MQTIIWAIGSMAVLMLIISFLSLGYTLKGKLFVVLASFILSLGGLASVSIFPLWQTALMLFALIIFVAYFMNNRMGTLILKEDFAFEEVFEDEIESAEPVYDIESLENVNLVKIDEELADASYINLDSSSDENQSLMIADSEEIIDNETEVIDEDISFLLERNTDLEVNEQIEETTLDKGYLSDIESLLEIESEEKAEGNQEDMLEEIQVLSSTEVNEPLDDSLFDFLLAQKEVAAERDDGTLEEIETKKKVVLQK
ncbi:hypothetical protein [Neobacillus soli]|uniref:hypothetical protein n=1 Tax=Neobacillus soli TaxID=220688 RepID=UPI000824A8B4|nr:hypothetical protein [Neobacillus soli]